MEKLVEKKEVKGRLRSIPSIPNEADILAMPQRKYVALALTDRANGERIELLRFGDRSKQHGFIAFAAELEIWFAMNGGMPKRPEEIPNMPRKALFENNNIEFRILESGQISYADGIVVLHDYDDGTKVAERILRAYNEDLNFSFRRSPMELPRLMRGR